MSCTNDCQQGRQCICRKYTIETVPKATWRNLFHWSDAIYTALLLAGSAVLGLLIVYFVVLAISLYKI